MSDGEATEVVGAPVALATRSSLLSGNYLAEFVAELHSGLRCAWTGADDTNARFVSLDIVLLPAEATDYDELAGCLADDPELISPTCGIEAVVNGTRVSGRVTVESASVSEVEQAVSRFLQLFDERAARAAPAPVAIPALGAWAHPVDCAAVVAAADLSAVPGLGVTSVGMRFPFGGHDYGLPAVEALENGDATFPYCWIEGEQADVAFVAMGGGRWLESTEMVGATPFAIDGYESAYVWPVEDDVTRVDVFNGPNWLEFKIRYTSNAKALADALFAGLNATAAQ